MRVTPALLVAFLVVCSGCMGLGINSDGPMQSPDQSGDQSATAGTATQETTNAEENVSASFVTNGERTNVTLEVANSPDERSQGLMHRESLPENHGMVFVFDEAQPQTFWMKNTPLPLDIIFISADGTVINVEQADPQPNASDLELDRYSSDEPAKYVVEMRQGFANREGIESGTTFVFDGERPTTEN
ncbi:DUF192 domain-containing protein [Haladaptatus cibarius]|uniref:DUF192 domain-containing protein n=1 Tax=Haladaptatus cibarius TaxID=453847 RepID=UPI000679166B|nr:DUF192 domain-containing protein [Haladaptatus cibarius]